MSHFLHDLEACVTSQDFLAAAYRACPPPEDLDPDHSALRAAVRAMYSQRREKRKNLDKPSTGK